MTDHGDHGTWWFNIIPLALSENDEIHFLCWNADKTELKRTISVKLSERDWLKKLRNVTGDPSNKHRVKVNVHMDFRTNETKIIFGRKSDGWYKVE